MSVTTKMSAGSRLPRSSCDEAGRARKSAIAHAFDSAAGTYDAHAWVQRRCARKLAAHIAALPLPARPNVLEIGCGTGFLSAALARRFPLGRFLFTDLSAAMAGRCRANAARRGIAARFAVMDGELPAAAPVFDLIASSFAFQWFIDLAGALANLSSCLRPGGQIAFATMGAESLAEWRALHDGAGVAFAGMDFPSAGQLAAMTAAARLRGRITEERVRRRHRDAAAFLRELKSLGAGTPGPDASSMNAARLRRVLRAAEPGRSFAVTYHVLYGTFTAPLAAR